jgi:DNA-directed RNA polymerase subunit F
MRVNSGEWTEEKNQRRIELVHKKYDHGLTDEEGTELADLQFELHEYLNRVAALPIEEARRLYHELLQKALKSQVQ